MILAQLSRRERILAFVTVFVIILAGLINFVILPLGNKWQRMNAQILALHTKLNRYLRILAQQKIIEARYSQYADYLKLKVSDEEVQAQVLQEVENLGRKSGVSLTNIIPSTLEDRDFYRQFQVRIELEADILSLCRFLYEIQKSKQLLGISRLSIATKGGAGELLRCLLQLDKVFLP